MIHMNDIQNITVARKGLVSSPKGAVSGITQVPFLKVGDLYISTTKKRWGFSVSVEPFGNSVCVQSDTPRGAAQKVALDYDRYAADCGHTALPIPQSYLDRWGTAAE
jgi:hypothetical protein